MKNIAIILAGGTGQRLGDSIPKQFLKVAGKKVIEHTLDVFQNHPQIDEIAVVSNPTFVNDVENIAIKNNYTKLKKYCMVEKNVIIQVCLLLMLMMESRKLI